MPCFFYYSICRKEILEVPVYSQHYQLTNSREENFLLMQMSVYSLIIIFCDKINKETLKICFIKSENDPHTNIYTY